MRLSLLLLLCIKVCYSQILKVCSLNVWGLKYISRQREERIRRIAFDFPPHHCDIITLQELFVSSDYILLQEFWRHQLPHSIWYRSGVVGSGLAIFSRFPIDKTFYYPYRANGKFKYWNHGDWFAGKGFAHAQVRLDDDKRLNVITTHMIANYEIKQLGGKDVYALQRIAQIYELARYIKDLSTKEFLILVGDFNCDVSHPAWKSVMENGLFSPGKLHQVPFENTFNLPSSANYRPEKAGERIDHIFFSPTFALKNYSLIMTDGYSDHAGISASFLLVNQSKRNNEENDFDYKRADYLSLHGMLSLLSEEIHGVDGEGRKLRYSIIFNAFLMCLLGFSGRGDRLTLQMMMSFLTLLLAYKVILAGIFLEQERAMLEQLWNEWSVY